MGKKRPQRPLECAELSAPNNFIQTKFWGFNYLLWDQEHWEHSRPRGFLNVLWIDNDGVWVVEYSGAHKVLETWEFGQLKSTATLILPGFRPFWNVVMVLESSSFSRTLCGVQDVTLILQCSKDSLESHTLRGLPELQCSKDV